MSRSAISYFAALTMSATAMSEARAESFAASIELPAEMARTLFVVDPKIDARLSRPGLDLFLDQREHLVVELADLSDPRSATYASWTGAQYLQEPAYVGTPVDYMYRDRAGRTLRGSDGRPVAYRWYEMPDGRMARYVTGSDGRPVGTYLIDPVSGAYEFALDADGDRIIDFFDATTPEGAERIVMTERGRELAEMWNSGLNPMCFDAATAGLLPGGFGADADPAASLPGCGLRHGAGAGGHTGSLGHPGDPYEGRTPLDQLCDSVGGGGGGGEPPAWIDPRDGVDRASCGGDCAEDLVVCAGFCTAAAIVAAETGPAAAGGYLICIAGCEYAASRCESDCRSEAATSATPPAEPSEAPSRYRDTDGDGRYDSEDTDGDGTTDTSCSAANCGVDPVGPGGRHRPDPTATDAGGWDLFCSGRSETSSSRPRGWGSFEIEKDCPDPAEASESKAASGDSVPSLPEGCVPIERTDVDELIGKGSATGCLPGNERGCEPNLENKIRARFAQGAAALSVGVQIVCDPLLCQPGLYFEAGMKPPGY